MVASRRMTIKAQERAAREELYARLLAIGTSQVSAYMQAGYKGGKASASRCAQRPEIKALVAKYQGREVEHAEEAARTERDEVGRLIEAGQWSLDTAYERFLKIALRRMSEAMATVPIASAGDLLRLANAVTQIAADARVASGGVSDRTASAVMVQDAAADAEDALARRLMVEYRPGVAADPPGDAEVAP